MSLDTWFKEQSFWSWGSYFLGLLGFFCMFLGLLVMGINSTYLGATNEALDAGLLMFIASLVFNLYHIVTVKLKFSRGRVL